MTTQPKVETKDTSLSGLWRDNKSKDAGIDLASVLDGCRILAQSLVHDVEVTFAGVDTAMTNRKRILLTAKYVQTAHPVPGDNVDIVLGQTVHEIGHVLFSEDKNAYLLAQRSANNVQFGDYRIFKNLVEVMEDAYINHIMTGYPGYRDYLMRERRAMLGKFDITATLTPLKGECDRIDILNAIVLLALYGAPLPVDIQPNNLNILASLLNCITKMCTKQINKNAAISDAWVILRKVPVKISHEADPLFKQPKPPEPPKAEPEPGDKSESSEQESTQDKEAEEEEEEEREKELENEGEKESAEANDEPDNEHTDDANDVAEPDQTAEVKPGAADDETEPEKQTPEDTHDGESDAPSDKVEGDKTDDQKTDEPTEAGSAEGNDDEGDDEPAEPGTGTDGGAGEPEKEGDKSTEPTDGTTPEPTPVEPADQRPEWKPINLAEYLDNAIDIKDKLDPVTANEVKEAVIEKRNDLTQLVSLLAGHSTDKIVTYTPAEDDTRTCAAREQSSNAEEAIRKIFQEYRLKKTADYRGLTYGRLSKSRLHRVAFGDNRVFQRRERPEEIDLAIELDMDLSGSQMHARPLIEQIVVSMVDAMNKEKVEFTAIGYSCGAHGKEGTSTVLIPRLYDKETGKVNLNLVREWGSTPSYEGLAAGIAQLMRLSNKKQKVLLHFTDGVPNSANSGYIPEMLASAREKGIIDIHFCISGGYFSSAATFKQLYGEDVRMINSIDDLPAMIEQELRSRLKL